MVLVIAVTQSVMFRLHRSVTWAYGFGSVVPVHFLAVLVYSRAWRLLLSWGGGWPSGVAGVDRLAA
jgi:hypothetical protein